MRVLVESPAVVVGNLDPVEQGGGEAVRLKRIIKMYFNIQN